MNDFNKIPFDNIIKFGQQTLLDNPRFNVSWILGRFCNYNCSYCWPYARSDKLDFQSLEDYKKIVDSIKQQARQNNFNEFHWSFSGGEPTAYKQLNDLVKHLQDDMASTYQSIHMTTNLSPGSKWWNTWCKNTEMLQRRSITASFHDEFAKEQEFGDKCLQLQYELVHVTINQVMVPEKFDELYARMERFHKRGINVTLKPQSNSTASAVVSGYTDDMIQKMREGFPQRASGEEVYQVRLNDGHSDYFLDQAERFNAFEFNKFNGWNCNAGYQSIVIRGNEVKRAYSCKDELLGTISDGFEIFKKSKLCISESCISSADSKIPKVRTL
jgi:organic radical activating enzyme